MSVYTEEMARSRDCCVNRDRFCCASACMAWRWAVYDTSNYGSVYPRASKRSAEEQAAHPPTGEPHVVVGYCGRAGLP